MAQNPYRPAGGPSEELQRLAREGQARLRAAQSHEAWMTSATAQNNIRTALGAVHGAPMRRLVLVLLVFSVGGSIAAFVSAAVFELRGSPVPGLGFVGPMLLMFLYLFMAPKASRGAIEAERAWLAALPFPIDWYLELLASDPQPSSRIRAEIWWHAEGIDGHTLEGVVVAALGTDARVEERKPGYAAIVTERISGATGIRVNRSRIYRNHRIGKAARQLVEGALLPIHRGAPIARVKLSRGF